MTECEALMCLNAVSGLGSVKIRKLLEVFETGAAVWRQNETALCCVPGIGRQIAGNICSFDCDRFLRDERSLMRRHKTEVIVFPDERYPEHLRQIFDFPIVLYIAGRWQNSPLPGMAVVGSRRASIYGKTVAESFAGDLARVGITVVSGMARGIDAAAHQGCLKAGGKTIAVLGSGLSAIYPREHERLFQAIAESGCVVSEFPMATMPQPGHFPRRNRIISGLSLGVIVVEAADRSGALITARCALEHNLEVFAVPGKVGQAQASGTNRLIQQGAKLVMSVQDVLDEFPDLGVDKIEWKSSSVPCSAEEQKILSVLSDEPMYVDDIRERSALEYQILMAGLLALECRGIIKRLPGNYFVTKSDVNSKFEYRNPKEMPNSNV